MNKPKIRDMERTAVSNRAEVFVSCGRWHLDIAGITLCMETDICRDSNRPTRFWTKESLQWAADSINARNALPALIEIAKAARADKPFCVLDEPCGDCPPCRRAVALEAFDWGDDE